MKREGKEGRHDAGRAEARGLEVVDFVPLVREDGTTEFVQATPDLVTPPAIAEAQPAYNWEQNLQDTVDEMNAVLARWDRKMAKDGLVSTPKPPKKSRARRLGKSRETTSH